MSSNSDYWIARSEEAVLRGEKLVDGYISELSASFEKAKRELQKEIDAFYGRYAKDNMISLEEAQKALSLDELKDFKGRLKEFEKLSKESVGTFNLQVENMSVQARITRLQALQMECDAILQKLYQEQKRQIEQITEEIYTETYYRRLFDVEQYTGFQHSFSKVNTPMIQAVLTYPVDGADISTRLWRQDMDTGFKIRETLNRMFVTGRPPQDFAQELQEIIGRRDADGNLTGKKYEAYRLLYNEASFAAGKANMDAYIEDDVEFYRCLESLDVKTCEQCGSLDGCVFSVKKGGDVPEEYKKLDTEYRRRAYQEHSVVIGVNYPSFHIGCRGTTVPYYPGLEDEKARRMARDPETGKSVRTTAKTYEEWKASFVNNASASKDELTVATTGNMNKNETEKNEGSDVRPTDRSKVHTVGRIDIEKYRCITEDITTDEVIITPERIQHIRERRGVEFLKKYEQYFSLVLSDPDYIFPDDRPNTAIVCKVIGESEEAINLILRLVVKEDDPSYKNSVLTAIRENKKRFAQRLRNNTPLYKKN